MIIRTAAPTIHTQGSTVVVSVVTELEDLVDVVVLVLSCALTIRLVNVKKTIAYTLLRLIAFKVFIVSFV
jgi:hypothetical protein